MPTQAASVIVAGVAVGIIGFIAFLGAHAVFIAPIWARSLSGVPFAILGGLALASAFHAAGGALKGSIRIGAFGVGTWLALWPVTLFAAWLRTSGLRPRLGNWEVLTELSIAAATGALIGWATCRTRLGTIVFGIDLATLVAVMAGPIAVMNSRRAALLFISFLPIYVVAAFVIAGSRWVVQRRTAAQPATAADAALYAGPAAEAPQTGSSETAAGTNLSGTGQPLARLNFYLLEPRSDDGLVNWNFLDSPAGAIDALFNRALPIRKVIRPLAAAATVIREV